jgi:hypothetical protein
MLLISAHSCEQFTCICASVLYAPKKSSTVPIYQASDEKFDAFSVEAAPPYALNAGGKFYYAQGSDE